MSYAVVPSPNRVKIVTHYNNGLMTAFDKVKLDNLEHGASAYPLLFSAIVDPLTELTICELPVASLPSFTYFVDMDSDIGNLHTQVSAKVLGSEIDYVRSNVIGSLSEANISVSLENNNVVFKINNRHATEAINASVKVI